MNYILKKIVTTIVTIVLLIGVTIVGLNYYAQQKEKASIEALMKATSNSSNEKDYNEEMALIKEAAQEKRRNKFIEEQEILESEIITESQTSIEEKIKQYLGSNISKVGIGYYDIETGKGFSINGDKHYTAASTVKVQMNMVLFDMVKEGKVGINEALQYTQADYEGGTGILQGQDKSKPIPLLTLSDYSIIYSDNIATNMIIRRIGRVEMKRRFGVKLGHAVPQDQNLVTPNEGLAFLKMLYENKNNNQYYSRLIGIMKTTVYHDRLDKYVPKNIVAHKIGNYDSYVNDVGIVYASKPYIIAVYTNGLANANEVIANINKIIYEEHK